MKSGFVAIVGKTNSGKSTFLNKLLSKRVSIVSPRKQTTRTNIQAIYNEEDLQIIFVDTPGIHNPSNFLGEVMNKLAIKSLRDVDVILHFVDPSMKVDGLDNKILASLNSKDVPVFLIITKIDLIRHEVILKMIDEWKSKYKYAEIIPVSALKKTNVDTVLECVKKNLNEGPLYYDKNTITNMSDSFNVSEIIRERTLFLLRDEVPHSIGVEVLEMKTEGNLINIYANLFVEKESQKGIIIGKKGEMIKTISKGARITLERYFNKKVFLKIETRVKKGWRKNKNEISLAGINSEG